jgi:hypothetical protein
VVATTVLDLLIAVGHAKSLQRTVVGVTKGHNTPTVLGLVKINAHNNFIM